MKRWLRELRPAGLLKLAIILVVLGRTALVLLTPRYDQTTDLSIYQEVGELLVNGIDPYDFSAQAPLREKLRLNDYGADSYVKKTREGYNYYVSGNLPASTALYGLLEIASGGNPKIWRIGFVLGDLSIVLAAFFFLRRAGVELLAPIQKLAFLAGAVVYPSLVEWGTLWPADKQFQTALMMLLAGLLISQPNRPSGPAWPLESRGASAYCSRHSAFSCCLWHFGIFTSALVVNLRQRFWRLSLPPFRSWLSSISPSFN